MWAKAPGYWDKVEWGVPCRRRRNLESHVFDSTAIVIAEGVIAPPPSSHSIREVAPPGILARSTPCHESASKSRKLLPRPTLSGRRARHTLTNARTASPSRRCQESTCQRAYVPARRSVLQVWCQGL